MGKKFNFKLIMFTTCSIMLSFYGYCQSEILFTSNWEISGQATTNYAVGSEGTCPERVWTVMNAPNPSSVTPAHGWNNFRVGDCTDSTAGDNPVNVRTQAIEKNSGSYALEIEWNMDWPDNKAEQGEWALEIEEIHSKWPELEAILINEFYTSHWVKFSEGYAFPYRMKGIRWYSTSTSAGAECTSGNLTVGINGKSGEAGGGYGIYYNDSTEKNALFQANMPNNGYGTLYVSNYAGYSSQLIRSGTSNACGQTADHSTIGMNHPYSSSIDMFGPADNGSTNNPYWPGCVQEHIAIVPGIWYQVIEHRKIHDTEGLIEVWMRKGKEGELKKVIKLDKNAWAGTTYDVQAYDTRCITPGQSIAQIYKFNIYAYMNAFEIGDYSRITLNLNKGQKTYLDDFIVATTFDDVKDYGLSGTVDSPMPGSPGNVRIE